MPFLQPLSHSQWRRLTDRHSNLSATSPVPATSLRVRPVSVPLGRVSAAAGLAIVLVEHKPASAIETQHSRTTVMPLCLSSSSQPPSFCRKPLIPGFRNFLKDLLAN